MQVDHIGYVVKNIEKSLKEFAKLGYKTNSDFFIDEKRNIKIQFIKNEDTVIELIEPMNEKADAYAYYKKINNGPYHICYKVDDIDETTKVLIDDGYILVKEKEEAIAFNGKHVAFLIKNGIGLIELVEK